MKQTPPLEPVCPLFLALIPPKQGRFGLGSRYIYMSLKLRRLSTLRILFGQEVHRPIQVVKSEKLSGMIFWNTPPKSKMADWKNHEAIVIREFFEGSKLRKTQKWPGGVALTTGVQNLPATNLVVVVIFMPSKRKGVKHVKQLTYVYIYTHIIYVYLQFSRTISKWYFFLQTRVTRVSISNVINSGDRLIDFTWADPFLISIISAEWWPAPGPWLFVVNFGDHTNSYVGNITSSNQFTLFFWDEIILNCMGIIICQYGCFQK